MHQPAPALVRTSADGVCYAVVGDVYRFLATRAETDGRYATWEALVPPGGGPPPHIHSREQETFFVLEGEIIVQAGGQRIAARVGDFVHVPIGMPHSFKNESAQPARMLISVVPAGLEQMFFEVGAAVPLGTTIAPLPSKAEIDKLLALAPHFGVEILPPAH